MPYMSRYGRGDYMRGYRGDPFFGPFGGLIKKGLGYVGEKLGIGKQKPKAMPPPPGGGGPPGIQVPTGPGTTGFKVHPTRFLPGGEPFLTQDIPGVGPPRGYHFAKDGSGRIVRNRRMNPANPRALRRAQRRVDGAVRLLERSLKGSGYRVVKRGRPGGRRACK